MNPQIISQKMSECAVFSWFVDKDRSLLIDKMMPNGAMMIPNAVHSGYAQRKEIESFMQTSAMPSMILSDVQMGNPKEWIEGTMYWIRDHLVGNSDTTFVFVTTNPEDVQWRIDNLPTHIRSKVFVVNWTEFLEYANENGIIDEIEKEETAYSV